MASGPWRHGNTRRESPTIIAKFSPVLNPRPQQSAVMGAFRTLRCSFHGLDDAAELLPCPPRKWDCPPLRRGNGTGPCFRPTIDPKNTPFLRKMGQSPSEDASASTRHFKSGEAPNVDRIRGKRRHWERSPQGGGGSVLSAAAPPNASYI